MRSKKVHTLKSILATVVAAVMVMLSVLVFPPTAVQAASSPALKKTTLNIVEGGSYDLNIKGKIAGSTYTWTSSNKKVATVNKTGLVKGIKKGQATITCKVKAPKKTYTLTCKVSVLEEASSFVINNKVSVLNVGQVYDLNRTLIPASSNEKTTWTSSNKKIAAPDKNGKFTALKTGTVTITGTTTSGLKDSVTIKVIDSAGIVTSQEELNALLGTGVGTITIKTAEALNLTIPEGNYKATKLVVDAPNADITNKGVFKSIDIKNIKPSTWNEEAIGNLLTILGSNVRVIVADGAKASINIQGDATKVTIENNGVVEELVIDNAASVVITGTAKELIPVIANALNATVTSDRPLNVTSNQKITLVLKAGAEGTKVTAASEDAKPTIEGSITVIIIVGNTTTTINPSTSTGGSNPSGGNPGGYDPGDDYVNGVKVTKGDQYTKYELQYSYKYLQSIEVKYPLIGSYTIGQDMLEKLVGYLSDEENTVQTWKNTTNTTKTYDNGVTVTVTGTEGDSTKTVELTYGNIKMTYKVKVENKTVTVTTGNNTYTISANGERELKISPSPTGVEFIAKFK